MKLNVGERLTLTGVIPKEGSFDTMETVEKLKKALYLSEEEVVEMGLVQGADEIPANELTTARREVEISELGMAVIMKGLKKLDDDEKLNSFQYNVYKYLKEEEAKKKAEEQEKAEQKEKPEKE